MTRQLNVNQAATHFDISHRTVHRWIQSGKVKANKIDGQWSIEVEDLDNQAPDELSSHSHDTIMSLTRQIEKLQQALDQQQ